MGFSSLRQVVRQVGMSSGKPWKLLNKGVPYKETSDYQVLRRKTQETTKQKGNGSNYHLMQCWKCEVRRKKAGKQLNGTQKFKSKHCGKYQQETYIYNACNARINLAIIAHVKAGCGIWHTARLMEIAKGRYWAESNNTSIPATVRFPKQIGD